MTITAGTVIGGWRLINTLGRKFYVIRPVHGFGAQLASTGVSSARHWPRLAVSGSRVVVSSIVGAGSADRLRKYVGARRCGGWHWVGS
ncbi:MAG: inorganic phosphate transporter [Anaerolineae bacterium]